MIIPWSKAELKSLITTLRKHHDVHAAIREHNKKHGKQRSSDAIKDALERYGAESYTAYLKPAPMVSLDLPEDKRILGLIDYCKAHPRVTTTQLCDALDLAPKRLLDLVRRAREKDYQLDVTLDSHVVLKLEAPPIDRLAVHKLLVDPVQDHITVGIASDIHFGSRLHRRECLVDFIDTCYNDYGVRHILHPGDMVAGMRMYPGQFNEVISLSMEVQLEEVVKGLPRRPGLEYSGIGGNHDESFLKNAGADVMQALAKARPDFKNYGFYSGLFDIGPEGSEKVKVELHHPDKAGAYAISYHIQKEIEQIPPGMKPQVIFMGHTHQSLFLPDYRGVAGFYCGTFEEQTLFLKRKHIAPHLGGWVVKFGVTKNGSIKSMEVVYIRYFHSRRGPIIASGERYEKSLGIPIGKE